MMWSDYKQSISTFKDFTSYRWKWRWIFQSWFYKDVSFYWDRKNSCYVREIKNVKGYIQDSLFIPFPNQLVRYSQRKGI